MPISSIDDYISASKQTISYFKTNSVTTVAGVPSILINRDGNPLAGAINPNNTTTGIVPTDATTGYPDIQDAVGSNKLYLTSASVTAPVSMSIQLFDVLFTAGMTTIPTSGTTTVSLTSRPSFTSRVPFMADGVTRNFAAVELWAYPATIAASNHAHTMSIDYLDQGGAPGNTGNISTQNIIVNRLIRFPLASGDTGVSDVTGYNLNGIGSAAGTMVVLAMRPIGPLLRTVGGLSYTYNIVDLGMPEIFNGSALMAVCWADSTSSSTPSLILQISQK